MTVKRKYRKSGEGAIATYDFFDIAEGRGYVVFYPFAWQSSSATSREMLTSQAVGSRPAFSAFETPTNADFTMQFRAPKLIGGKVFASFNWGWRGGGGTQDAYVTFSILKNTTVIGTVNGADLNSPSATSVSRIDTLSIELDNEVFSPDDTLTFRFTMTPDISSIVTWIAHDPLDRTIAGATLGAGWTGGGGGNVGDTIMRIFLPVLPQL